MATTTKRKTKAQTTEEHALSYFEAVTARTVIAMTRSSTVTRKGSTGLRPQPSAKPTSQKARPKASVISNPICGEAD